MKSIKNKKIIFIIVLLLVVSSTMAFLYSTDTFQNIFVAASYKVRVVETFESPDNWKPGDTTPKTATLKNEGTVPIKVRVKLEEEWKDSNNQDLPLQYNEENVAIINFANENDYIYKDGYYYYDLPLNPGETTSSIIESVTFNPNYSGTVTCVENDDNTHTCSSSSDGYEGGTYKLTVTIEGVQEDYYVQAWGLPGPIQHQYLYNVLMDEAENNGLAKKYTGSHHDSFTEEPSKDIYHWYADNDSDGTLVQDKYNVIFADHCWQMIRTTDTGGVKLLYNGEVENNQCLNNRGSHLGAYERSASEFSNTFWYGTDFIYDEENGKFKLSGFLEQDSWNSLFNNTSIIGKYTCKSTDANASCNRLYYIEGIYQYSTIGYGPVALSFSSSNYQTFGRMQFGVNNSLNYIGYMYNDVYQDLSKSFTEIETVLNSTSGNTYYWYADSILYGSPIADQYNLVNPYRITSSADYSSLVGKYSFFSDIKNYVTNYVNALYYIADVDGLTFYFFPIPENETLGNINGTYTYGDSYIDNGNGTYTIENATTFYRSEWYRNYSNISVGNYMCKNAVNNTCSDLLYIKNISKTTFRYLHVNNNIKFAHNFTYDGEKYTLNNNQVSFVDVSIDDNKTKLNNAHYTCWNDSGECSTISYIYYLTNSYYNYVNLSNGEGIEDAINNMLFDDNVNAKNSLIKSSIDLWYERYMINYSDYLEDTIFCNNRSISSLGGWDPSGNLNSNLYFELLPDLICSNTTDSFSIYNSKAKLKYKVGLLTRQEVTLLNKLKTSTLHNIDEYYLLTPFSKGEYNYASWNGSFGSASVYSSSSYSGVRPVISLKPGIEYTEGDGSKEHPYIVKMD